MDREHRMSAMGHNCASEGAGRLLPVYPYEPTTRDAA